MDVVFDVGAVFGGLLRFVVYVAGGLGHFCNFSSLL